MLGLPESEQCAQSLHILQKICEDLGVPLAPDKQAGPHTTIEFLGITIDTVKQELRLPEEKLNRLKDLTTQWKSQKSCSKRELESLLGVLQHACTVIPAGRVFLRQIISLLSTTKQPHHHIRLNNAFCSDLTLWRIFALHWNGKGLISMVYKTEVLLTSHASGSWGCGAWSNSDWFQLSWDQVSQHFQVAIKELIPILIAAVIWGGKWKGCVVVANCDSEAVVVTLNSRCSKDPHLMQMLCTLFFLEAHNQFKITAKYIPGTLNTLVDHLSCHKLKHFHDYHHTASHYPSCIPENLLQWLLDPRMDWTSSH